jgi:ribosomal protein L25 (general stress protein Ctc)
MAEKKEFRVQAKQREGRGKNDARRARREGMVPVTLYGGGAETIAAVAPLRDLAAILRTEADETRSSRSKSRALARVK